MKQNKKIIHHRKTIVIKTIIDTNNYQINLKIEGIE
jgi:hypothetical protein